jgi:hypothetical protein
VAALNKLGPSPAGGGAAAASEAVANDAKKEKTRRECTPVKVWVTPAEKAAIAEKAGAHSMSCSRYLRALGLALPVQSTLDQRAVLDLLKINADLGRLGGLVKIWLTSNESFETASALVMQRKLERTLNEIGALQKQLKDRIEAVTHTEFIDNYKKTK